MLAVPTRSGDAAPEVAAVTVPGGAGLSFRDVAGDRVALAVHRAPAQGEIALAVAALGLREAASDGSVWNFDTHLDGTLRSAFADDARVLRYDGATLVEAASYGSLGIRPERARAELINQWLPWRLDHIVPELMHREGIDMWLIICRETAEDPLYWSLVPEPVLQGRRTMVLVYFDPGGDKPVERYSLGGGGSLYKPAWTDRSRTQFENLADLVKKLNPKKIGINSSVSFRTADGLSAILKEKLILHIGPVYEKRLVSAEKLCVGWLETRSPER